MLNKQQDISVELLNLYLLILERGSGGGREDIDFCCSTYLCIG